MKVLVACEESQRVCMAFRYRGHEAYSCDIQEPSGGHPEWHILNSALLSLNSTRVKTMDGMLHGIGQWDMVIAFPPCTYMANSGAVRMVKDGAVDQWRFKKAMDAKRFFMEFYNCSAPKVCIENPVPMKMIGLPPYSQIVQPYEHGHPYSKRTCLWLKGLPKLKPTNIITEHTPYVNGGVKDKNGNYKKAMGRKERDPKVRSKTFEGIALAMASQWG